MSVLLSWENPPETFLPNYRTADVWRALSNSQPRFFLVAQDVPWGTYEDKEGIDPTVEYQILYQDADNRTALTIRTEDIRKMLRPANLCKISFDFCDPDGFPAAAKQIEISNEPVGSDYYRRILTNHRGHAEIFAPYNQRLQFRVDGMFTMLDCVVPPRLEATWAQLQKSGSVLSTDSRGLV